jgi:CIC family chloride channel protein
MADRIEEAPPAPWAVCASGTVAARHATVRIPRIHLGARPQRTLGLSALTGAVTGLGVAGFEWVTRAQVFDRVVEAPPVIQAAALGLGLVITFLLLAWVAGGATPATSDEYIRNFHQPDRSLSLRPALGRLLAGVATLGGGGSLGYEGPSLYLGAIVGTAIQGRTARWFARDDAKVLMVAGAAAGVAAIFKAPATGAVFALEVPFRDDTARRMLLPALVGAASGYLVFVALLGTTPLFEVDGSPPFDLRELGGAALLGLGCGLAARGFAVLIRVAKRLSVAGHPAVRLASSVAVLVGLLALSQVVFGDTLSTGAGYRALDWVREDHGVALILTLLAVRVLATCATLAGGGVGGLFIPLVVAGALVGDATATALDEPSSLFPLIGVAALLGAGYRTPLAGVMFVAEATGRPGFVVPGLIASVASQLVMGDESVSPYQGARRVGHLERRFSLPIGSAITADVRTVPSDATLAEFRQHLLLTRRIHVPVVDDDRYVGMVSVHDLQACPTEQWATVTIADVCHDDWPTAPPDWTLEQAIGVMERADVDLLPVVDEGIFVGIVTTADIVRLDEIIGGGDEPAP